MIRLTTIVIGLVFLTSCDCHQQVSGIVIDHQTGRPIENATVYNKNKEWNKTLTDSLGYFELSSVSGGFRCPPMTIIIKSNKYDLNETTIPAGSYLIIKLKRNKFK
jgi:hypothetical protein